MPERLRILVAEKMGMARDGLATLLKRTHIPVEIVQCRCAADIPQLLADSLDCAFIDDQFPGVDPLQILRDAHASGLTTPIIILTDLRDDALAVEAMRCGAADYLPKSRLTAEMLGRSLERAIRLHQAERIAHEAEQRLRANEQRLNRIVETIADGVLILDADGRYTFMNKAAEEILGAPASQVVGRSFNDPPWQRLRLDGSPLPLEEHPYAQVIHSGKPMSSVEVAARRPDGRHVVISLSGAPLIDNAGRVEGVVSTLRDVTQSKLMQEALRESSERISALFKSSPLAIAVLSLDGNVQEWNPAAEQMFGWTAREVLHGRVPFVPAEKMDEYERLLHRARHGESFTGVEVRRRRKDGSPIDVSLSTALVRDAGGKAIGIIGLMQDITEARRLKEQLLAVHRMETVGRLAGGVAHDFNNLLAVISGYSESLLRRIPPDSPLYPQVMEIDKAAQRGGALTRQLLAFSRRQVVELHKIDLNQVIRGIFEMLRQVITDRIEIHVQTAPEPAIVRGDPGQIEQVLVNLALNARDAMPHGGMLTIRTGATRLSAHQADTMGLAPGRYVRLEVLDTGMGMDEELRSRIFEPFFTTKDGKGTGLGLSIVYGIVQQCGGNIQVSSAPGEGSVFELLFPEAG